MSIEFEIETVINRPIEEVFERIANISRYSNWLPKTGLFINTEQGVDGPVTLGTPYTDKTTIGMWHGEVIQFERPHKVEFQHQLRWFGIPVMQTRPGYQLESTAGGTKVYHKAEGELYGVFKLMRRMASRMAKAERKRTLNALKDSLQSS
ncbi:MAG: SRPBCC family protein [Anaerolineae bacterium]